MINSRTVKKALAGLTDTERQLLSLLTEKETAKEQVTDFLKQHDIECGSSVCAFLLNELADRVHLQNEDDPAVPRIRGVAAFFRYQNATAMMQRQEKEAILDADLILKIRHPDVIRPFPAGQEFLDRRSLVSLAGKRYADKVMNALEPVKVQNREYYVPGESFLPDLLFLSLYRAAWTDRNKSSTVCYLYDIQRYCGGKKPGIGLRFSILAKELQHRAGRSTRWLKLLRRETGMSVQKKIRKYTDAIWASQLPAEEEAFLFDLVSGRPSGGFRVDAESDYSLLLAYNAQKNGFQGYTEEQTRAFRDILQNNRMQKLRKIPAISKVLRALNENGIEPLLLKGAAFLCYYASDLPRMMGDIDIYIPPEQFDRAVSVIYALGCTFVNDTGFHIAVTSESLDIDIHRYIYKNGGDIGSDLYSRVISCSFLGSKVTVLAPEDMLVHQLVNRGRDLCVQSHMKRHFKWIMDCYTILEVCHPDADSLRQKAEDVKNRYFAELTLDKLAELFPEKFEQKGTPLRDRNYCRFLRCMAKRVKNAKENPWETVTGLKYMRSVLQDDWEVTKISKIAAGSRRSVLRLLLEKEKIYTLRDLIRKIRISVKNSKG